MKKVILLATMVAMACESAPRPDGTGVVNNITVNAPAGKDGKDGVNGANGINGKDGKDGKNGIDGVDGTSCSTIIDFNDPDCFFVVCNDASSSKRICNGKDGADGKDGVNGVSCTTLTDPSDANCSLIICGDGTSAKICNGTNGTNGVDGTNGKDGIGCSTLTDPTNAGCSLVVCGDGTSTKICNGIDGTNGSNGANGVGGKDGTNGTNGANGVSCTTLVDPTNSACAKIVCTDGTSTTVCGLPDCDDGKECTMDLLAANSACVHLPRSAVTCDDGNACTTDDECKLGVCEGGPAVDCDDGDPWTLDSCSQNFGCQHQPLPKCTTPSCDDGNACTVDVCDPSKGCAYEVVNCDDNNAWTTDTCDANTGCKNMFFVPSPFACYGLRFKVVSGTTCVGYPAPVPGAVNWSTVGVNPDADGLFSAPLGICSVLCTTKPLTCKGQWSGVQADVDPWTSAGCSHLSWPNGYVTPESGCTWDSLSCQF